MDKANDVSMSLRWGAPAWALAIALAACTAPKGRVSGEGGEGGAAGQGGAGGAAGEGGAGGGSSMDAAGGAGGDPDGGGVGGGGGMGGDAGGPGDAGADGPFNACTNPGELTCDGEDVRLCGTDGRPTGPVVDACGAAGMACSAGRCTTLSCKNAEKKLNFAGCIFYSLDVDNSTRDDILNTAILLGNPTTSDTASVELQVKMPGVEWKTETVATIPAGGVELLRKADNHHEGPGLGKALAWRIVSDAPIVAYHVQSDDSPKPIGEYFSETSGGTILIPAHVLGRSYMTIGWSQQNTDQVKYAGGPGAKANATYGVLAPAAQVVVVGVKDGTHVTFTAGRQGSLRGEGGVPATPAGGTFEFTLDDGDVMNLYSANEGDDLTGSSVTADKPIAVFSGNIATSYSVIKKEVSGEKTGTISPDMTHDQMLPLTTWGKLYVASRLQPLGRFGGVDECNRSGVVKKPGSYWKILASEDGTTVSFEAEKGIYGVPTMPVTLDKGEFTLIMVGGTAPLVGDFFISSDKPIQVAQFTDCEPSMAMAVPVEQLLTDFLFVTPPIYEHQVAIVRKAGTSVTLDGTPVGDENFVTAGGGFEVARLNIPLCDLMAGKCGHRITGTDIGVALHGEDTICGYAFAGGLSFKCVNKTAGCRF